MQITITPNALDASYVDVYANDERVLQAIAGPANTELIENLRDDDPTNGPVQVDANYRLVTPLTTV